MNAKDQYTLLKRIEEYLTLSLATASQLPDHAPLTRKLIEARDITSAWRCDQEAELPPED